MTVLIPGFFFVVGILIYWLAAHLFLNRLYSVKAGRNGKLINASILSIRKQRISAGRGSASRNIYYATVKATGEKTEEVLVDHWHKPGSNIQLYRNYLGRPCMYNEMAFTKNTFWIIAASLMGTLFIAAAILLKIGLDKDLVGSGAL